METAKEVVEQVFNELKALLGPYDCLIVTCQGADLIDEDNMAIGLDNVIDVLADRIKAK